MQSTVASKYQIHRELQQRVLLPVHTAFPFTKPLFSTRTEAKVMLLIESCIVFNVKSEDDFGKLFFSPDYQSFPFWKTFLSL